MPSEVVFSCEHGGNRIPSEYQPLFVRHNRLLQSHRGYDRGALLLARRLARRLQAPLFAATVSRLLVDLNRSPHNPRVFSGVTRSLNRPERQRIIDRYFRPHRELVERRVRNLTATGASVVHIAVHTFTPSLGDRVRNTDIGLLYDPRRPVELGFCLNWKEKIERTIPSLRVRRNYPYRGTADGLTTYLRRRLPSNLYAGIELEVNQRLVSETGVIADDVFQALICPQP